jgi:alpha-L-rhamnosidase
MRLIRSAATRRWVLRAALCGLAASATIYPGLGVAAASSGPEGPGAPTGLTVDSRANPIGIDEPNPTFAWIVTDQQRGEAQTAYQILVSATPNTDPASALWDSSKVDSPAQAFVAYAGPALASDRTYYWTVRTWDEQGQPGPFAPPAHFGTGLHDSEWQADWIRLGADPAPAAGEQYAYLRKVVSLSPSPITRAVAYVSASHQYELWIDGRLLDRGESFAYPDDQYYQATDVTSALRAGTQNAVGVLYHWYGPGKGRPAAEPGVVVHLSVDHQDGTHQVITTDGSWRALPAQWVEPAPLRNDQGDRVEIIDGRAEPQGWDLPGYNDSSWQPAYVVGPHPTAPWTHLRAQGGRITEHLVHPVSVTKVGSDAYVADFGKVIAARPTVDFSRGSSGRQILIQAGYLLDPGGTVSVTHGTQMTDMSYQYTQRAGSQQFLSYGYLGFRYLQVDSPGEALTTATIAAYARHAAMPDENAASFSSSNSTLDAVWSLARHSALYGTQEQFLDTPTREKGPFLRDGYDISWAAMRAFGDRTMTEQALNDFAASQARFWPDGRVNALYPTSQGARDIPDYTEIYPEWVMRYYEDTGDLRTVQAIYPVMVNVANYVARYIDPGNGLVTNLAGGGPDYLYGIVDWPASMRYGYDMNTVARTAINELAVDTFDQVAAAARALGLGADAQMEQGRAAALTAAINQHLTRPDGVYVDGLEANGTQSTHASQIANSYAIAYGIVPPSRSAAVGAYVARLGISQGPMTAETLLRALSQTGQDAKLVQDVTDTRDPGWGYIVSHGGTFTWEDWTPSDANGDSMSHGWGSTVLVDIQEYLLGVTPAAPGYAALDVRPPNGGIDSASGTVPTEQGPVKVNWSAASDASPFKVSVSVPANSSATVWIPSSDPRSVTEGGRQLSDDPGVRPLGTRSGYTMVAIGSGSYSFSAGPASTSSWFGSASSYLVLALVVVAIAGAIVASVLGTRRRCADHAPR